jgi:hypothetical protein
MRTSHPHLSPLLLRWGYTKRAPDLIITIIIVVVVETISIFVFVFVFIFEIVVESVLARRRDCLI